LDPRTKELVALGASVASRCQPCFRHHLAKARELRIEAEDIQEAVKLGNRISEVGGQRMVDFVEAVIKE
jgi:AhpD family alkylhydroperoxidase